MTTLQTEIGEWGMETISGILKHLHREVKELEETNKGEEAADCLILLFQHAHLCGYDLMIETFKKFDINKKRQWGKPDKDGVIEHIKGDKANG